MPDAPSFAAGRQSPAALLAYGLLLAGATAAIALAGFAPQGNLGVFLLCAGVAMISCPPSAPVEGRWWLAGGALVAFCACALLPIRLLTKLPEWRHSLGKVSVIPLPSTISPAPSETLFWLALLMLTVVLGLFLLAQPVRSRPLVYIVLGATLICGSYAATAIVARFVGWSAPLVSENYFGFFPNRNHTATFLVTGSILSLSLLNHAFLARRWILLDLALAALVPCVVALLFFNNSRAGVVFLIVGGTLWLIGLGGTHRNRRLVIGYAVLLLAAGGLFVAFQSNTRDRLLTSAGFKSFGTPVPHPVPSALTPTSGAHPPEKAPEFRLTIWRDTLKMIADSPLTGTGLGTFSRVFPQYRRNSLSPALSLHPESDWLLFIAEAGLPAFCCLVLLGIGLTRRMALGRGHSFWPLRWGCGAAAVTAVLHGIVDVPAHRAALGWWILLLAGLSFTSVQSHRNGVSPAEARAHRPRWSWQRFVFIVAGMGALTLGGMLTAAEWFKGPALPPFLVERSPFKIFALQGQKKFAAAEALARRIIALSPLFDQPYFHLGVALASQSDDEGTDAKVDAVFHAQRLLDPATPSVAVLQAKSWSGYDPVRQAALLLDALTREAKIDLLLNYGMKHTLDYFADLVAQSQNQPDVQRYLLSAVRPDIRFEHAWRTGATPEIAHDQAVRIAEDEALDAGLSATDRSRLRLDWYLGDDQGRSLTLLPDGQGTAPEAWPVRLRQMVNAGHFEQAVGELSRRYGISLEMPQKSAGTDVTSSTEETRTPFQKAWLGGDIATARQLLNAMPIKTDGPAEAETLRWRAAMAAHDADWSGAWLNLEQYVRQTRQMVWP